MCRMLVGNYYHSNSFISNNQNLTRIWFIKFIEATDLEVCEANSLVCTKLHFVLYIIFTDCFCFVYSVGLQIPTPSTELFCEIWKMMWSIIRN